MNQAEILKDLTDRYPDLATEPSDTYYWSPQNKTVFYDPNNSSVEGTWALLHETGHALLGHVQYYSDIELVMMEVDAWDKATEIAAQLDKDKPQTVAIDEDHVQDCLDSYRDWLHKRSLCPDCKLSGVQTTAEAYSCVFCHKKWTVSSERFCRPYRRATS